MTVLTQAPAWPDLLYLRLRWGEPQTIGDLAEAMGAPRRAIEKACEELRRSGAPVISCSEGLYLSTDHRELERAAGRLRLRAIHQLLGARALRETARRYRNQRVQQMGLWAE